MTRLTLTNARIVDPEATSPEIPDHVLEWLELEQRMYHHGKAHWQNQAATENYQEVAK